MKHRHRKFRVFAFDGSNTTIRTVDPENPYVSIQITTLHSIDYKIPVKIHVSDHIDEIEPLKTSHFLDFLEAGDTVLMDRRFYSFDLIKLLKAKGVKYVIRLRNKLNINNLIQKKLTKVRVDDDSFVYNCKRCIKNNDPTELYNFECFASVISMQRL